MNKAISKHKNHPTILLIKDRIRNPASFSFKEASSSNIEKGIWKYIYTFVNIPTNILRARKESCSETLAELFNNTLLRSSFATKLKVADVSLVFKKNDLLKTENYRPVSVLPVVSKILERFILHKQMSLHVDRFLTPYLCGYRKRQQTLILLLEK